MTSQRAAAALAGFFLISTLAGCAPKTGADGAGAGGKGGKKGAGAGPNAPVPVETLAVKRRTFSSQPVSPGGSPPCLFAKASLSEPGR